MRELLTFLKRRLTGERGFTLAPMMGGLLAILITGMATAAIVDGDAKPSLADRDRKQALAAAEAGVQDYLARLKANPDYWTLCVAAGNPSLNQVRPTAEARTWSDPLPGTTARYSIELLPVRDETGTQWTQCDTSNPQASMIDANGTFKIRSTGEARPGSPYRRSVVATFSPDGLLQYIYFTEYETSDPTWTKSDTWGAPTMGRANGSTTAISLFDWSTANCAVHFYNGRSSRSWSGRRSQSQGTNGIRYQGGSWSSVSGWNDYSDACNEITFAGGDKVLGPMHTNDSILVCGNPQFGERSSDSIEVNGPGDGWRACGSGGSPTKVGTWKPNAGIVNLPKSNTQLRGDARYVFTGATQLRFDASSVWVTGEYDGAAITNQQFPVNDGDVIYVADDGDRPCGVGYDPVRPYSAPAGCGNVQVQGTYGRSLTVGAQGDVIVREDVIRANDGVVLGLIANGWIRIWHDFTLVTDSPGPRVVGCRAGTNLGDVQVDAALMALNHSITVDGYFCGPGRLGTLTVRGAMIQKFRGPVGTSGGSGTGYIKDYKYDRRLQYRQPPRFLDPILPNWTLKSTTEQVTAE